MRKTIISVTVVISIALLAAALILTVTRPVYNHNISPVMIPQTSPPPEIADRRQLRNPAAAIGFPVRNMSDVLPPGTTATWSNGSGNEYVRPPSGYWVSYEQYKEAQNSQISR